MNASHKPDTSTHNDGSKTEKLDFFDKPKNVTLILRVFYVLCVLLVAADFIVHRHIYVSFEEIPAFYAIYGFVACVVLVVIAKEMRKVFMKDENYYDARNDETDMPERCSESVQHEQELEK